jgi:hypothetical protein
MTGLVAAQFLALADALRVVLEVRSAGHDWRWRVAQEMISTS